jgi:hypothetical protein
MFSHLMKSKHRVLAYSLDTYGATVLVAEMCANHQAFYYRIKNLGSIIDIHF